MLLLVLEKGPASGGILPVNVEVGDQLLIAITYRDRISGKPYLAWTVVTATEDDWASEDGGTPDDCVFYANLSKVTKPSADTDINPIDEHDKFDASKHIHLVPPELAAKWAKEDEECRRELEGSP